MSSFDKFPQSMNITITVKSIVRVILLGLLVWLLFFELRDLLLVVLTSIVIASFVETGVRHFSSLKIGRSIAVVIIYFFIVGVIGTLFYVFVPILIEEVSYLISFAIAYFPQSGILSDVSAGTQGVVSSFAGNTSLSEFIGSAEILLSRLSGNVFNILSIVFGGVFNLILIFVISFYLSMQEQGIANFLRIISPRRHEEYIIDLWHRVRRKISFWVQGQFILSFLIGILTYAGLLILDVKYALLLAILTAVLELIPFGVILAVIPAISFGFLEGGLPVAISVAIVYIIVQQLENYVIAPMVVNKVVGVSPLVVILSVLIGAKLASIWGIILAVPVAVAILEFMHDVEIKKVFENSRHPELK